MQVDVQSIVGAQNKGLLNVVFAPHCDDELIGCYSLLKARAITHVVTPKQDIFRMQEMEKCAKHFGFEVVTDLDWVKSVTIENAFYPSANDSHPEHKLISQHRAGINNWYYSVDLQTAKHKRVLSTTEINDKCYQLNNIYKSQSNLWANDASYYLFESIVDKDWVEYEQIRFEVKGNANYFLLISKDPSNAKLRWKILTHNYYETLNGLILDLGSEPFKIYLNDFIIAERL
jgi:hypothetical protein